MLRAFSRGRLRIGVQPPLWTIDAYAARTGRAIGTVRTQLRAIFGKTDTHRQSELALFVTRVARAQ
jgi:DNA-binding NarL/FixJ family response regulator